MVNPLTVKGDAVPLFDIITPPFDDVQVAEKLVIALPLAAPAVNDTTSEPVVVVVEADTAFTFVGGTGDPTFTGADAADAGLLPRPLVALTVHV